MPQCISLHPQSLLMGNPHVMEPHTAAVDLNKIQDAAGGSSHNSGKWWRGSLRVRIGKGGHVSCKTLNIGVTWNMVPKVDCICISIQWYHYKTKQCYMFVFLNENMLWLPFVPVSRWQFPFWGVCAKETKVCCHCIRPPTVVEFTNSLLYWTQL